MIRRVLEAIDEARYGEPDKTEAIEAELTKRGWVKTKEEETWRVRWGPQSGDGVDVPYIGQTWEGPVEGMTIVLLIDYDYNQPSETRGVLDEPDSVEFYVHPDAGRQMTLPLQRAMAGEYDKQDYDRELYRPVINVRNPTIQDVVYWISRLRKDRGLKYRGKKR